MKLLAVLFALTLITTGCENPREAAERNNEAWEKSREPMRLANLELEAHTADLELQLVELRFGTQMARTWDKCKATPPKNPAHQKTCKAILDKVARAQQAEDAADAREKANW